MEYRAENVCKKFVIKELRTKSTRWIHAAPLKNSITKHYYFSVSLKILCRTALTTILWIGSHLVSEFALPLKLTLAFWNHFRLWMTLHQHTQSCDCYGILTRSNWRWCWNDCGFLSVGISNKKISIIFAPMNFVRQAICFHYLPAPDWNRDACALSKLTMKY